MAKPKNGSLCQDLYDQAVADFPQLLPHAEALAKVILRTADASHVHARKYLAENFSEHVADFNRRERKRKVSAKSLARLRASPDRAYDIVSRGLHDGFQATLGQFMATWEDPDDSDLAAGNC